MIFAALVIEREPLQWSDFPAGLLGWMQIAGTIAAIGLIIWLLAIFAPELLASLNPKLSATLRSKLPGVFQREDRGWTLEGKIFAGALIVAGALYALALLALIGQGLGIIGEEEAPAPPLRGLTAPPKPPLFANPAEFFFTFASLAALVTAALPILMSLFTRLSGRRIWALARLSIKEALHSRVVLIFSLMAIIFLFADWFVPYKPEDQLRNYVRAIYWTMPFLFLMTASVLGSFTIPNDLRRQTIHTIVTKPVERFEIFLGRFVGFAVLITLGMLVLSGLSLIYVVRGVGEAAAKESYKARKPIFGNLSFHGTRSALVGENVGRIWDYRSYITARDPRNPGQPRQFAIWSFDDVPSFGDEEKVKVEFTFDIFRLSKGLKEQPGITCTFIFVDGSLSVPEVEDLVDRRYKERYNQLRHPPQGQAGQADAKTLTADAIEQALIKELRIVYRGGVVVLDYHTGTLDVPVAFFNQLRDSGRARQGDPSGPAFKVLVEVEEDRQTQQAQMLGVARRDLYLLPDVGYFEWNFLKGMIGVWFLMLMILGVALAISTYLSGVIALLVTLFVLLMGVNRDFIYRVATGQAEGGGPIEASIRLAKARPLATQLDPGAGYDIVKGVDQGFQWTLGMVFKILPDVERFDLHEYVASGFDISWGQMLFLNNFLIWLGYLIPWAILAYYLLRFREIANPG